MIQSQCALVISALGERAPSVLVDEMEYRDEKITIIEDVYYTATSYRVFLPVHGLVYDAIGTDIKVFREGKWMKYLESLAKYSSKIMKIDENFQPVDDSDLFQ